jgi:hypothetical protein
MYFGTCTNNSNNQVGKHEVSLQRAAEGFDVFFFEPRQRVDDSSTPNH